MVQLSYMDNYIKEKIKELRKMGMTYGEIIKITGLPVSKSSLSYCCRGVELPVGYKEKVKKLNFEHLCKARISAKKQQQLKKEAHFGNIYLANQHLRGEMNNIKTAKLVLSSLYLAEGGKTQRGALVFGNSDVKIIKLFLFLLRKAHTIDERKFRCTVQCRADQDVEQLRCFWSNMTKISLEQFYKTQIDKRTIGKKTLKQGYFGVCRIDYFSAKIFHELMVIGAIMTE